MESFLLFISRTAWQKRRLEKLSFLYPASSKQALLSTVDGSFAFVSHFYVSGPTQKFT
jgi:hypothetical protein